MSKGHFMIKLKDAGRKGIAGGGQRKNGIFFCIKNVKSPRAGIIFGRQEKEEPAARQEE